MSKVEFTVFKGSKNGDIVEAKGSRELDPFSAEIEVTHSGLCGTDEHYRCIDQGLGHEGIGIIKALGSHASRITDLKKGDRVGLGWVAKACLHCKECLRGRNFTCLNVEQFGTANLDTGTFSTGLTRDVSWLIKIPDAIPSEFAGPLTCGGATVWQPLYEHGLKAGDRVGIIGIGGLGHLAIQFAAKMGMEVIVFSTTAAKKDEAMKFGATEFWPTKDVKELKDVKPLQSLIITTSVLPDFALYFPILAPDCKIFPLTVSMDSASIPMLPFIVQNLRIVGTTGAQKFSTDQMMEFAAKHGIRPQIETFEMTQKGITEAMQKLKEGKMRYRGVVVRPDLM